MSLVSIIIPCYNSEKWVGDAIQSALSQTHKEIEVIVVDDGSTDMSLEVIRSFGERIRYCTGMNRGACSARNTGVAMAKGEFIQFLDSDDLLHPNKISRSLEALRDRQETLVYSLHEVRSLDPDCIAATQWNRRDDCNDALIFMLQGDLPTPAPLHRRMAIERIGGFREDLPCAQDRDFHIRMAMSGTKFELIPEVLHTIRRRKGSIGTSNPARVHVIRGQIALETVDHLKESNRLTENLALHCAGMLQRASRDLCLAEPDIAREYAKRSKQIHPSGGMSLAYSETAIKIVRIIGPRFAEYLFRIIRTMRPHDALK
jgi:glycosyltransferase involved in cell wall biosynthesis